MPFGYKDMLALQSGAGLVVTVTEGTNRLVPDRSALSILEAFRASWGKRAPPRRPEGWDGHAAERVADAVEEWAGSH